MALPSSIMASAMIKSTYSLDPETVRKIESLAAFWKVSKSEVVRRVVAAQEELLTRREPTAKERLEALDKLQESLKLTPEKVRRWEAESRRIRRNAFRKREWTNP
jgi:hypothetical protein